MATPDLIHIDALLAPIEGDNPCGDSLRYDPAWDELASARRGRNDAVSAGADLEPEWSRVQALAADLLETRTKDLQIAGYLTEALVHTGGFAGFRDGLRVIQGLVERFWDRLYPELDESDPDVRAAPLVWLTDAAGGSRLAGFLPEVPIALSDGSGEVFSLASRQTFQQRPKRDGESDGEFSARSREAAQRAEQFDAAVLATPDTYYIDLRDDVAACLEVIRATERDVDEKLGVEHSPSWSAIRTALEDAAAAVEQICRSRGIGVAGDAASADGTTAGAAGHAANGHPAGVAGPIRTRADAVARLREVVEFFKQTEPHSPVAHLVQRSVRWANMPLEGILAELIQDDSALTRIWDTLGVRPPEPPED